MYYKNLTQNHKLMLKFYMFMILIVSIIYLNSISVNAAKIVHEGKSGDIKWTIDDEGTLVLKGNGKLSEKNSGIFTPGDTFIQSTVKPWLKYDKSIRKAKIKI